MTTLSEKARTFAAAHRPGAPLVIYNIWDAGGAKQLEKAGAPAVATGSASVAAAHGYQDGQAIPLDLLLMIAGRISASVTVPVSVDFEGGYAADPETLTANVLRLIGAGAAGLNFEDQVVGGQGLYPKDEQARRIAAVFAAGQSAGVPLFINARTDLFLQSPPDGHARLVAEALDRAQAYAAAGAAGLFVPGLTDPALIAAVVKGSPLPVNIMMSPQAPDPATLASLGVARLSHGPFPWYAHMAALAEGWANATVHQRQSPV